MTKLKILISILALSIVAVFSYTQLLNNVVEPYRNDKYGFELTPTRAWKNYRVQESTVGRPSHNIVNLVFEVPQENRNGTGQNKPYPWDSPFYLQLIPANIWDEVEKNRETPSPRVLAKNARYVYTVIEGEPTIQKNIAPLEFFGLLC